MQSTALGLVLLSTILHAGWNLLARAHRSDATLFFRVNLLAGLAGLPWAIWWTLQASPLSPTLVYLLLLSACFQALYFFGLFRGYQSGDFTIVYPLARALPVLVLAVFDLIRGRPPDSLSWLGMLLIVAGCLLAPQTSFTDFHLSKYRTPALLWVGVTAAGTIGYSAVDKVALEQLPSGFGSALQYGALQWLSTAPIIYLVSRNISSKNVAESIDERSVSRLRGWRLAVLVSLLVSSAYALVLWAYQLVPQASSVVALRQFSIVIGVFAAVILFREPAPRLRITAALIIVAGIVLISLG